MERFAGFSSWDYARRVTRVGDFNGDGADDFALLLSNDDRPGAWDPALWWAEEPCGVGSWDQGGVYIFLGGERFDLWPDLVYWTDEPGLVPEALAGGLDWDGDGLKDIALGAFRRDAAWGTDVGGVDVVLGRPLSPTVEGWLGPARPPLQAICAPAERVVGSRTDDHLGFSLAPLRDLNGDGCDELAVGARLADIEGQTNEGAVFVLFGRGAPRCPAGLEGVRVREGLAHSHLGASLAAGDVTGDGLDELAIGAVYLRSEWVGYGGVQVLLGADLAAAPRAPLEVLLGREGGAAEREAGTLWASDPARAPWRLYGTLDGSEAGWGVALLSRGAGRRGGVALSERGGSAARAGLNATRLHRVTPNGAGLERAPGGLVWDEERPGSIMGEAMSVDPAGRYLLLGAREGGGAGLDQGSAFLVDLSRLWED